MRMRRVAFVVTSEHRFGPIRDIKSLQYVVDCCIHYLHENPEVEYQTELVSLT